LYGKVHADQLVAQLTEKASYQYCLECAYSRDPTGRRQQNRSAAAIALQTIEHCLLDVFGLREIRIHF
jgi:hypothetical protein